jgi:hypothetical protein
MPILKTLAGASVCLALMLPTNLVAQKGSGGGGANGGGGGAVANGDGGAANGGGGVLLEAAEVLRKVVETEAEVSQPHQHHSH